MEQKQTKEATSQYERLLCHIRRAEENHKTGFMYTGRTISEEDLKGLQTKGYPCKEVDFEGSTIYIWNF